MTKVIHRGVYHNWAWKIVQDGDTCVLFIYGAEHSVESLIVSAETDGAWVESYLDSQGYGH